jgi:hypothetical protein
VSRSCRPALESSTSRTFWGLSVNLNHGSLVNHRIWISCTINITACITLSYLSRCAVGYIYLETDRIMVYEFQCINAYDRSWLAGLCFCIKCSGNGGCTHTRSPRIPARSVQTLGHYSLPSYTNPCYGYTANPSEIPPRRKVSSPYHWTIQLGEDNDSSASLQNHRESNHLQG